MPKITVEMSEEAFEAIGSTSEERDKFIRESVAVQAVRMGLLPKPPAAELAGMPRLVFLELLVASRVPEGMDVERVREGFEALRKLFSK